MGGGGCFSLWLPRSSAVPHEAMIPNCLNRTSGRNALLQNALHLVYTLYSLMVNHLPVNCTCTSVCKPTPAVSRDPTSSRLKSLDHLISDRSNSIIACSEHHTRAVPYPILCPSRPSAVSVWIYLSTYMPIMRTFHISVLYTCPPTLPFPSIYHTLQSEPPSLQPVQQT
ncbi:hypothetical protein F5883DRAFT_103133 [Diaporthe sp. PMI_573]|nr:hypothetical protein F5883DRAFT_103133 [Diaporthaceae sp. PMI_573]